MVSGFAVGTVVFLDYDIGKVSEHETEVHGNKGPK